MNGLAFTGNCVRDPMMKFSDKGKRFTTLTVKSNVTKEIVSFIQIVCFDDLAEHCAESLRDKARVIIVHNGIWQDKYINKEGKEFYNLKCIAKDIGASLLFNSVDIPIDATQIKDKATATSGVDDSDLF